MDSEAVKTQVLELKNRERLTLNAVYNVEHFSPDEILLKTATGNLKICGRDLKLEDLSKQNGGIVLVGRVNSLSFTEIKEKRSFFKDLLR